MLGVAESAGGLDGVGLGEVGVGGIGLGVVGLDWVSSDWNGLDSAGAKSAEVESMELGESACTLGGVDSAKGGWAGVCSVDSVLGAGGLRSVGAEESSEVVLVSVAGELVAVVRGACGSSGVAGACADDASGMGSEGAEAEGMGVDGAVESDAGADGAGADGAEVGA